MVIVMILIDDSAQVIVINKTMPEFNYYNPVAKPVSLYKTLGSRKDQEWEQCCALVTIQTATNS